MFERQHSPQFVIPQWFPRLTELFFTFDRKPLDRIAVLEFNQPITIMNRKPIYPNLERWRTAERLNQRGAAERLRISQGYYSRLEQQQQHPHRKLAKFISDETGVPLETILGV